MKKTIPPTSFTLDEDQSKALRTLESAISQTKFRVVELYQLKKDFEDKANEELATLKKKQDDYLNQIKSYAEAHGVDLSDPSKGKWSLDTSTMTFTRLEE